MSVETPEPSLTDKQRAAIEDLAERDDLGRVARICQDIKRGLNDEE